MEIDSRTQAVIEEIRRAFCGVKLGDGISLLEANGLDDREDEETLAALRALDEKEDWEKIPAERLNHCFCSPSFLDPAGIRFNLPAFLTAELKGEYHMDIGIFLTGIDDWKRKRFAFLNDSQRQAVRSFLIHVRDDFYSQYDREAVDQALDEFWTCMGAGQTDKENG